MYRILYHFDHDSHIIASTCAPILPVVFAAREILLSAHVRRNPSDVRSTIFRMQIGIRTATSNHIPVQLEAARSMPIDTKRDLSRGQQQRRANPDGDAAVRCTEISRCTSNRRFGGQHRASRFTEISSSAYDKSGIRDHRRTESSDMTSCLERKRLRHRRSTEATEVEVNFKGSGPSMIYDLDLH